MTSKIRKTKEAQVPSKMIIMKEESQEQEENMKQLFKNSKIKKLGTSIKCSSKRKNYNN